VKRGDELRHRRHLDRTRDVGAEATAHNYRARDYAKRHSVEPIAHQQHTGDDGDGQADHAELFARAPGLRQGTRAHSLALATPSTGLLTRADDGKGTVLQFGYRRVRPEPGIVHRYALLASLTVDSAGYGPVTYGYDYGRPVWHSPGRFLVGLHIGFANSGYAE